MDYIYNYKGEKNINLNQLKEPILIKFSKTYSFLLYRDLEANYTILCNNILSSFFLESMYNKVTGEGVSEIEDRLVSEDTELIFNLLNKLEHELLSNRQKQK